MTQHSTYLCWALLVCNICSFGQPPARMITGVITSYEEAMPLEGAAVLVKGTGRYSGSQADGIYYINIFSGDSVLVFSYNEYQSREIRLTSSNEYNVALKRAEMTDQKVAAPAAFTLQGRWRGVFKLTDGPDIPFLFDISGNTAEKAKVHFINGEERFESGRLELSADSLFISLSPFDNELAFAIRDNLLSGVLRRQDQTGTPIPVSAQRGDSNRFIDNTVLPAAHISDTYDIVFKNNNGKDEQAVGLFSQEGNKLRATFLRITGDSRYLEGIVSGNNFYLSSFIGAGPVYYRGTVQPDGTITGQVIGARGAQDFQGSRNEEAALPDPYALTYLKEGYTSLDFSFPDLEGRPVSLKDSKYQNKVVIITITGTWCPNCLDEAAFMAPWYKKNRERGVEVIAIHYERKTDTAFVRKAIKRYKEKFDIQYDELIAGPADKQYVAASLPALNTFLSFPTTIFIDKKGNVARIHTGYTGPATGKYYTQFVKGFNEETDRLLRQ